MIHNGNGTIHGAAAIMTTRREFNPEFKDVARARFLGVQAITPEDRYDVKSGSEVQRYSRIARNPVVKTALDTLVSGILWSESAFQSTNDYDKHPQFKELDEEIIEMLERMVDGLEYESWPNVVRAILYNGLVFGFSVAELIWDLRFPFRVITSIKPKPSYNFDVYINDEDDIESLYYTPRGDYLDPRKFIVGTWPFLRDGYYYGTSILQSILHDVETLEKLEERRAKASQQLLFKPLIHYYEALERSKDEVSDAQSAVRNMGSDNILQLPIRSLPERTSGEPFARADVLEVLPDRTAPDALKDTAEIIAQLERRITRTFGVGDDMGMTTTKTGSLAKSRTEYDVFSARVQEGEKWLETVINRQLIDRVVRLNYRNLPEEYKLPRWHKIEFEEDVTDKTVGTFVNAIQGGIVRADEPFIRERLNFPPPVKAMPAPQGKQLELIEDKRNAG